MIGYNFFRGIHSNCTQTGVHQTSCFYLRLQRKAGDGQNAVVYVCHIDRFVWLVLVSAGTNVVKQYHHLNGFEGWIDKKLRFYAHHHAIDSCEIFSEFSLEEAGFRNQIEYRVCTKSIAFKKQGTTRFQFFPG